MDKKKQFQIQNINAKIKTYESNLQTLLAQRTQLLETNINTQDNQTHNITNQTHNITNQIKTITNQINIYKNDINNLTTQLHLLPSKISQDLSNELEIYNSAQTNVNNMISNTITEHQQNLIDATNNKNTIKEQLESITQDLNIQNDKINDLQINAHASRKETLKYLHNKKLQKKQLQEEINNINSKNNIYQDQIKTLNEHKNILEQLKHTLIEYHYSNTDITTLNLYDINTDILNFDIDITKLNNLEYFNKIIVDLDIMINELSNRINIINIKAEKARIKNNIQINNQIDSINLRNRMSFNDEYKIEKQKFNELQAQINILQSRIDNYDNEVINKIIEEHYKKMELLDTHNQSTLERINIMTDRINEKYIEKQNELEQQIQNTQHQITQSNKTLQSLLTQLNELNIANDKQITTQRELDNINNTIINLENTINILKNDIKSITN